MLGLALDCFLPPWGHTNNFVQPNEQICPRFLNMWCFPNIMLNSKGCCARLLQSNNLYGVNIKRLLSSKPQVLQACALWI